MEDKCISCGAIIPEGRQICPNCEQKPKPFRCPCIKCVPPKRTPTCHGTCPDYAEYIVDLERHKKEKSASQMVDVYFSTRRKFERKWNP